MTATDTTTPPPPTDSGEPATSTPGEIRAAIAANPSRMTSQHARELGVPEAEVIDALPREQVTELRAGQWEAILRSFEALGNVHVIVTNAAVTLESFGQFGNFSHFGGYFNVQTKTIDMHIRPGELARVFAVTKPGHMDGVRTLSFQFYDPAGRSAFKVFLTFGGKVPAPEKQSAFDAIRERFAGKTSDR